MAVRYTREFKYGDVGPDVEGVARALSRAGHGPKLATMYLMPKRIRRRWGRRKQKALKAFKRKHGLKPNYIYGVKAHRLLSKHFDAKAKRLMLDYKDEDALALLKWRKMLAYMQLMNKNTQGYSYGAGHGTRLASQDSNDPYDCSSSTSKALFEGGFFPDDYAWTSGEIARNYGEPGKGKYFTVYAHSGHAFIRLHKSRWWRFDTSPYGDRRSPKSGPRLRYLPRLTWGFTARHWKGM